MRRFIGLLMLFVILFPLVLGAGAVLVTRQVVIGVQTEYEVRRANIEQRLEAANQKIELREATIGASAIRRQHDFRLGDAVGAGRRRPRSAISRFATGAFDWPSWVQDALGFLRLSLPDIPAVNLTIPGLSAVRDFLQNIFDSLAQLSQALADIAGVADAINEVSAIAGELTGFVGSLGAIIAPYGTLIVAGVVGGFIWFVAVYLVLAYTWLVRGWAMLRGRPVTV